MKFLDKMFNKDTNDSDELSGIAYEIKKEDFREKFINEMIRNASRAADPNLVIKELLRYIGENLESDRAYIFEENQRGTYDNTYEWCREGVSAEINNLQDVPYEGMLEVWFKQFEKSHNILIYDLEKYKKVSEAVYDILKPQGVNTLVTGPLVIDGKMIGFYGVDNPPAEAMQNISELINMMEFIFSMLIRFRNNDAAIEVTANHDQLTGCRNRNALTWIYDGNFNKENPIAVVVCDINGLKLVNDLQGHVAGDSFITRVSGALIDTFGKQNVYRIGGDEFLVVLMGDETKDLDKRLEALKITVGNTVSIGAEKRGSMDITFDELLKLADKKMYVEKQKYYEQNPDKKDKHQIIKEYTDILSRAGLGIWNIILKDGEKPRMRVNEKMAELLGIDNQYMTEEEIYSSWFDRINPDAIPSVNASVQEMINDGFSENTYQWIHPQKGNIYVRCGGTSLVLQDGTTVLKGYHGDVTKIVRNEQRHKLDLEEMGRTQKEALDVFNTIHEALGSANWNITFDEEGQIARCSWSDRFRQMLGYTSAYDFPDEFDSWVNLLHPTDKEKTLKEFWDTVNDSTSEKSYNIRFRIRTKNKGYRWFRAIGILTRRNDGTSKMFYGILIDVDSLTIAEQSLDEAKQDNERKISKLQGVMSDVVSSIYGIIEYTNMLKREQDDPKKRTMYIERIEQSAGELRSELNEVQEISRE